MAAVVGEIFLNAPSIQGFYGGDGMGWGANTSCRASTKSPSPWWCRQSWGSRRDGMMQNHVPGDRKGPLTGRKGGAMEHNACDLLAGATSSPWQHLKAAVKCQSVAMLRHVMWGA